MQFIRTTIVGGIVFLVPIAILAIVFGKILQVMSRLAGPLADWIPLDRIGGIALANVIAVIAIVALCFAAGLVARGAAASEFVGSLESKYLYSLPGYRFIKSLTGSLSGIEDDASLCPVLARFDDASQVAFLVEELPDARVVVYVPGAPDPWAGSVFIMAADRIERIEQPLTEAVRNIRSLGAGSGAFLAGKSG